MLRRADTPSSTEPSAWARRYGRRYRFNRITDFPSGIDPPERVRIYRRGDDYYNLQWWDPVAKRNLNMRVDGDLISAILRSREIDEQIGQMPKGNHVQSSTTLTTLINAFLDDLTHRVEAGEVAPQTCRRYASAIEHYDRFIHDLGLAGTPIEPDGIDREHALRFTQFLATRKVAPNGHPHSKRRHLTRPDTVLDTVRAMFQWAADPGRGALLPVTFVNPFLRSALKRRRAARDPLAEPDITLDMAFRMIEACDRYALGVLAPLFLYGLRASEPIFLFHEHVAEDWVRFPCIEGLNYQTKGLRDKRLPRIGALAKLWGHNENSRGLVLTRRRVAEGREKPSLLGASLEDLIVEYARRTQCLTQAEMLRCRDATIEDAGGLTYGHIDREFRGIARQLEWPRTATLKDCRHLFNTCMANGGMPEHERRYLMGHAPGRDAIVVYTHMNRLAEHFRAAVDQELGGVLTAVSERVVAAIE
jgi:integrase